MSIADFSNKKILICYIDKSINELADGKPWRKDLFDCVSKYWEIPDIVTANSADFVIGVNAAKTIMIVAKPNEQGWQKVKNISKIKDEEPAKKLAERYAFEGNELPEMKEFLGKTLPSNIKFPKGVSYPLLCVNGEIIDW